MVIPLYHSMNVVNTGLQQIYNNMHEHGETFFSMRHQVICQHHPCFSTMLFGMESVTPSIVWLQEPASMPRLRVGLTFSGALTSLCPSNLAHLLSIGPKQRTFVTAAINCLWIQFFCCGSCRCCLSDPFTSRFFLPYHDKCCHAKLKKHNGMPCDQKPYMTQRSRKGKAPLMIPH